MCGRFVLRVVLRNLQRDFPLPFELDGAELPPAPPRFNIAPTQMISIVRMIGREKMHALVRWGLIPRWWPKDKKPKVQINGRGETLFDKPYFRDSAKNRRCLVLADGYYEWRRDENDRPLQAYFVERADGKPFAMAGVWDVWKSPAGDYIESVAVVTTPASADIAGIHDRMPLILAPEDYLSWLDAQRVDEGHARELIRTAPAGTLIARAVGNRVNKVANDDPANLAPATPDDTPPLKSTRRKPKDTGQGSLFD
jgi:putative SOS response-associated peptidase YedK